MEFKQYCQTIFGAFETFARGYSPVNAAALAVCADLVYEDWIVVEKVVRSLGFSYFKYADVRGTQSFTIADENKIIVAFRGTEVAEFADIKTDIDTSLQPYFYPNRNKYYALIDDYENKKTEARRGLIHQGFKESLDLIWTIVYRQVLECIEEDKQVTKKYRPIWVCGHSLGGALANLATSRFWEHDVDEINGTYTFGQPRVGNKEFADWFNHLAKYRYFRVVNNNDIVARVPFFKGYAHVGEFKYFDSRGALREEDLTRSEMLWDRMRSGFFGDFAKDHSMRNYIRITASALGHTNIII